MTELVLDSEGRIAIPEALRARLHLKPGDTVAVEVHRAGYPSDTSIPPQAEGNGHGHADTNARVEAARAGAAGHMVADTSLDEARDTLNNRDLSVGASEWPEDSEAWVDELRGGDTEKIDRIGSLLNDHYRG